MGYYGRTKGCYIGKADEGHFIRGFCPATLSFALLFSEGWNLGELPDFSSLFTEAWTLGGMPTFTSLFTEYWW